MKRLQCLKLQWLSMPRLDGTLAPYKVPLSKIISKALQEYLIPIYKKKKVMVSVFCYSQPNQDSVASGFHSYLEVPTTAKDFASAVLCF